jgi:hypothetical protein
LRKEICRYVAPSFRMSDQAPIMIDTYYEEAKMKSSQTQGRKRLVGVRRLLMAVVVAAGIQTAASPSPLAAAAIPMNVPCSATHHGSAPAMANPAIRNGIWQYPCRIG